MGVASGLLRETRIFSTKPFLKIFESSVASSKCLAQWQHSNISEKAEEDTPFCKNDLDVVDVNRDT